VLQVTVAKVQFRLTTGPEEIYSVLSYIISMV